FDAVGQPDRPGQIIRKAEGGVVVDPLVPDQAFDAEAVGQGSGGRELRIDRIAAVAEEFRRIKDRAPDGGDAEIVAERYLAFDIVVVEIVVRAGIGVVDDPHIPRDPRYLAGDAAVEVHLQG